MSEKSDILGTLLPYIFIGGAAYILLPKFFPKLFGENSANSLSAEEVKENYLKDSNEAFKQLAPAQTLDQMIDNLGMGTLIPNQIPNTAENRALTKSIADSASQGGLTITGSPNLINNAGTNSAFTGTVAGKQTTITLTGNSSMGLGTPSLGKTATLGGSPVNTNVKTVSVGSLQLDSNGNVVVTSPSTTKQVQVSAGYANSAAPTQQAATAKASAASASASVVLPKGATQSSYTTGGNTYVPSGQTTSSGGKIYTLKK